MSLSVLVYLLLLSLICPMSFKTPKLCFPRNSVFLIQSKLSILLPLSLQLPCCSYVLNCIISILLLSQVSSSFSRRLSNIHCYIEGILQAALHCNNSDYDSKGWEGKLVVKFKIKFITKHNTKIIGKQIAKKKEDIDTTIFQEYLGKMTSQGDKQQ